MVVIVLSQCEGSQIFGSRGMFRSGQGFTVQCHLESWNKAGAIDELGGSFGGEA